LPALSYPTTTIGQIGQNALQAEADRQAWLRANAARDQALRDLRGATYLNPYLDRNYKPGVGASYLPDRMMPSNGGYHLYLEMGKSHLCGAMTREGLPCRRRVLNGIHCYQHGG
jgi:hypothetical protein